MLDFAEQTGSGIVIMVWSFLIMKRSNKYTKLDIFQSHLGFGREEPNQSRQIYSCPTVLWYYMHQTTSSHCPLANLQFLLATACLSISKSEAPSCLLLWPSCYPANMSAVLLLLEIGTPSICPPAQAPLFCSGGA